MIWSSFRWIWTAEGLYLKGGHHVSGEALRVCGFVKPYFGSLYLVLLQLIGHLEAPFLQWEHTHCYVITGGYGLVSMEMLHHLLLKQTSHSVLVFWCCKKTLNSSRMVGAGTSMGFSTRSSLSFSAWDSDGSLANSVWRLKRKSRRFSNISIISLPRSTLLTKPSTRYGRNCISRSGVTQGSEVSGGGQASGVEVLNLWTEV